MILYTLAPPLQIFIEVNTGFPALARLESIQGILQVFHLFADLVPMLRADQDNSSAPVLCKDYRPLR
jgi:hypothetical protein